MEEGSSEFGRGLAYNLGLFLCHQFMFETTRKELSDWPGVWFNGASDHLYELQVEQAPEPLRERFEALREKGLTWGHGFKEPKPTPEDVKWIIQEAKNLLLEIDRANGIDTKEAEWD